MRKPGLCFIAVFVVAFIVAACGRQVTPNPPGLGPGGAPPGYIAIHFDTAATFNFSKYQYMIVFNTTGNGITPSTDTIQTNWAGYSGMLMAYGNGAVSAAKFIKLLHVGHQPPGWIFIGTTPQTLSYNPNSNGTGTEFSMLAQKQIFTVLTSPSPSSSPASKWTFNAFTAQGNSGGQWQFFDSMGAGGPIDPQWVSPTLCMTESFDNTYFALDTTTIPDPSAQIMSVEISNNPVHPTSCP